MQSAEQLLFKLETLDVKLSLANGKLSCNAPKGVITPALREDIKHHKANLLHILGKRKSTPAGGMAKTLPQIARHGELPLSFSQERIWRLSKLDPDNHNTGNIHFAFRIAGSLDVVALEKTIHAIIQRHEVFRTSCQTINNRAVQGIVPEIDFKLALYDLTELPALEVQGAVEKRIEQYVLAPFDLAKAPILRAELLRIKDDEYVFLLATHLYIFDGWSTAILFKELSSFYSSFHNNEPSVLAPLTAQYVDFSHWHRHWFESDEVAKQAAYWKEKLKQARLVNNLPQDRPRQLKAGNEAAHVDFILPSFLTEAIRGLSQKLATTLFITLQAAWQTLLYGYTRQDNITTGSIVSNRRMAEVEDLIGSFANNILISSDISAQTTFKDLVGQVGRSSLEAYAHQDIPFEGLLGELNPRLNSSPLFRVMFVLHQHQSIQNEGLELCGLKVQKIADKKTLSKYDLELIMVDRNGVLSGLFEYNTGIFDRVTIESMKDNFFLILKKITENPELALADLPSFSQIGQLQTTAATCHTSNAAYESPSTPVELKIAKIWQDMFGMEKISLHDRFIDLGGHSLLAIKLVSMLKQAFNVDIALVDMIEFPSIAELAKYIDKQQIT